MKLLTEEEKSLSKENIKEIIEFIDNLQKCINISRKEKQRLAKKKRLLKSLYIMKNKKGKLRISLAGYNLEVSSKLKESDVPFPFFIKKLYITIGDNYYK